MVGRYLKTSVVRFCNYLTYVRSYVATVELLSLPRKNVPEVLDYNTTLSVLSYGLTFTHVLYY